MAERTWDSMDNVAAGNPVRSSDNSTVLNCKVVELFGYVLGC